MHLPLRATLVWLGLFCLAFVNGALREVGLKKLLGVENHLAHQLSCLTGAVLWTALVWFAWDFLKISTRTQTLTVGTAWFVATLLTETFLINRLMGELTWEQILQSYNVLAGDFWALVLIYIGFLPALVRWLKQVQ